MAVTAENCASKYGITREAQDCYALRSQQLADAAWREGRFVEEVVPVEIRTRKGVQVVDRDERKAARPCKRLGGGHADEQRADQPGALRDRDAVDAVERRAGLGERLADHRRDELEMTARRDLGDDPAEARVQVRLRRDDVRTQLAVVGDERRGRLVAGRLDAEDQTETGSFHMMSASSRLSV